MLPANHGSTSIEENRSYCRYKFYMAGIRHFALKHNALAQRKVRPNATFIARSPILAPIESPYATSYYSLIVTVGSRGVTYLFHNYFSYSGYH